MEVALGKWLALCCARSKTEKLVNSLAGERIGAWAPMWRRMRRLPRSDQRGLVLVPALPGFVFCPRDGLEHALSLRLTGSCPFFYPLTVLGTIQFFEEVELEYMRRWTARPVSLPCPFPAIGSSVKVVTGSFCGLVGVVTKNTKRESYVRFDDDSLGRFRSGRSFVVKIPPFLFEILQA